MSSGDHDTFFQRHGGGWERGSLSLETAIVLPAMLALLLLVVQMGIYEHARDVARSAAQVGAQTGRGIDTASGVAQQASARYLADVGGLSDARVSIAGSGGVSVTVTGRTPSLVPFVVLPQISATATLPKEQVTQP